LETWLLQKVDERYPEGFEMWCWRRVGKISWADNMRNEVLYRVKEERIIIQTIQEVRLIRLFTLCRKCLLKHVIEGKIEGRLEVLGRRGRRHKQLLNDFKEKREYWKLKKEALDHCLWRTCFGRGYGSIIRQTTE
jgi:hypothetical protein